MSKRLPKKITYRDDNTVLIEIERHDGIVEVEIDFNREDFRYLTEEEKKQMVPKLALYSAKRAAKL